MMAATTTMIKAISLLLTASSFVTSAPAGSHHGLSPVASGAAVAAVYPQMAPSTQYHSQDELGQYSYGYVNSDGQSKAEVKGIDGSIAGKYSYVDAHGKKVEVSYVADDNGFRAVGDNFPSQEGGFGKQLAVTAAGDKDAKSSSGGNGEEEEEENEEQNLGSSKKHKKVEEENEDEEEEEDDDDEDDEEEDDEEEENKSDGGEEEEEKEEKKVDKQPANPQLPVYSVPQQLALYAAPTEQASLPVYSAPQQPALAYAGQPTTIFQVSNVPLAIQATATSGRSHPQLVYVARAVQLGAAESGQSSQVKGHASPQPSHYLLTAPTRQPTVANVLPKSSAASTSTSTSSVPVPVPASASAANTAVSGYRIVQAAPIRSSKNSFHTYVPVLPSSFAATGQQVKLRAKSTSGGVRSEKPADTKQQELTSGHVITASQYLPGTVALLPGYGYIPTQYTG